MSKKILFFSISTALLLSSCANEFNNVYKSNDWTFRYEFAKEKFAQHKFTQASTLFGDMINVMKGTDNAEECLFLYGLSAFNDKDYESAADIFKKYYATYPKGDYAEQASFLVGESLYNCSPEPRLDQSETYSAMRAYQDFMDIYPLSSKKETAQNRLYELQDKLVEKELHSAKLYYNLGTYFGNCTSGGNNYEACIVTSQNVLKDYPYTTLREDFATLIMKSKYQLAASSVEAKRMERYQDAEDECYGFINEYPESKERALAEKYIAKCKKVIASGGFESDDLDK
ncbi:MAG: outer membrane protein assembly factor BamD [Prevotella sp.]|mgnify:FL=1|nr:outer membrane protein assembly factor BamD [Prevotella sp.]MCI6371016.1 outer membrane protein assembly factor BamD [Prevotella sp.]MCI6404642.1 outer membrane protein assembly factor BamD [Prevotella sp.]MCI6448135.1 outer membrane protein assembly factor BamD [Prevotella sp.]MCI6510481.1 outer membrane protein assembly factor BamD [Prevotella sp.]